MNRLAVAATFALFTFSAAAASPAASKPAPLTPAALTLEQIMANPDWIGNEIDATVSIESARVAPYFSIDGKSIYYRLKRTGSPLFDLHRIDLGDGRDSMIDAAAMTSADGNQAVYDATGTHAAFARNGDIFLRDLRDGSTIQVTRSEQRESTPQFSSDGGKLSFRSGNDWFVYDLTSRVTTPAAVLKTQKNPDAAPKSDALRDLQLHLFSTLQKNDANKKTTREHADEMQRGDASRAPLPFYLGDDVKLVDAQLSPDTRWMLAVTQAKSYNEGKQGKLTRYVTDSGYEEFEPERIRVGRNDPAPQTLWLVDLAAHTSAKVSVDGLPGIHDDPLKSVREENAKAAGKPGKDEKPAAQKSDGKAADAKPALRAVGIAGIRFARDGANAAVEIQASDNKDRWIASLNLGQRTLITQHRLHDDAWINWSFNSFGWENDNRTLWYESEESGYAHLYTKTLDGKARALTHGKFEVSHPRLSADGRWFYLCSNAEAPYAYDVYRVPAAGGEMQRVTHYQGVDDFALSHDGRQLLVTHSSSYVPPQLAVIATDASAAPRELTDTRTPAYKALHWVDPQFVQVPSTHFKGAIWAKFYKPADFDSSTKHPAVLFVHGAGYLQDVRSNWSYYFREQMFQNLLLQHGYVVLDMDYRASAGYGRDWRTAIYRNMGHPELEDLLDGKRWLAEKWNIDPKRVGIYGGSYGGFMTLMALFRAPGEFAAGAALRPVTDWTQYDDGYTADILNRPQIDPIAYQRSSPIEFAAGLQDPLLICHGVIDDNVLFEDSMRLYERLIELHKDNFTISPYPLDRHDFSNADSWLDEYKRIYRLFEANLK